MKKLIIAIALFAAFLWPVNYFVENQGLSFKSHHIFEFDYQAQQQILRNINVYPSILLARMFQNKLVIITGKYLDSFFSFVDPNYYYFGSHPREVINGQNYPRLPLLTVIPLFWYLFRVKEKSKKTLLVVMLATVCLLSFLTNFYKFDLFLWPFFLITITVGLVDMVKNSRNFGLALTFFLMIETIFEYWKTIL